MGFGALALVVILVLVAITSAFDKRKGTGYYTPYGPSSVREDRRIIDKGKSLYRNGALNMGQRNCRPGFGAANALKRAVDSWEEAAALGNVEAMTGLGIVAMDSGDLQAAQVRWSEAFGKGDDAAYVFTRITTDPSPKYSYKSAEGSYLGAMGDGNVGNMRYFAVIARSYSLTNFADELQWTADRIEQDDAQRRRPW